MERRVIQVLVCGANPFMREGIVSNLTGQGGIEVVGQVSNRLELMEFVHKFNPDVVILTEDSGNGTGISETINLIHHEASETKVLMLTKQYDEDRELSLLRIGVLGFLTENTQGINIIKCVEAIDRGEMWVRRRVLEKCVRQLSVLDNSNKAIGNEKSNGACPPLNLPEEKFRL